MGIAKENKLPVAPCTQASVLVIQQRKVVILPWYQLSDVTTELLLNLYSSILAIQLDRLTIESRHCLSFGFVRHRHRFVFQSHRSEHASTKISSQHFSLSAPRLNFSTSTTPSRPTEKKVNHRLPFHPNCRFVCIRTRHRCLTNKTTAVAVPFQTHTIFSTYPRGSLEPQFFDISIQPSCHFSVRTHYKGALQPKLDILAD